MVEDDSGATKLWRRGNREIPSGNPNVQIPNPNEIPKPNVQFPMQDSTSDDARKFSPLDIGSWDFIGIWDLDIGISSGDFGFGHWSFSDLQSNPSNSLPNALT